MGHYFFAIDIQRCDMSTGIKLQEDSFALGISRDHKLASVA